MEKSSLRQGAIELLEEARRLQIEESCERSETNYSFDEAKHVTFEESSRISEKSEVQKSSKIRKDGAKNEQIEEFFKVQEVGEYFGRAKRGEIEEFSKTLEVNVSCEEMPNDQTGKLFMEPETGEELKCGQVYEPFTLTETSKYFGEGKYDQIEKHSKTLEVNEPCEERGYDQTRNPFMKPETSDELECGRVGDLPTLTETGKYFEETTCDQLEECEPYTTREIYITPDNSEASVRYKTEEFSMEPTTSESLKRTECYQIKSPGTPHAHQSSDGVGHVQIEEYFSGANICQTKESSKYDSRTSPTLRDGLSVQSQKIINSTIISVADEERSGRCQEPVTSSLPVNTSPANYCSVKMPDEKKVAHEPEKWRFHKTYNKCVSILPTLTLCLFSLALIFGHSSNRAAYNTKD